MLESRLGPSPCICALGWLAVAVLAGGCTTQHGGRPSGSFSFDVGTQAPASRTSWNLDDLPPDGSIQLEGYITPRMQPGLAAALEIFLGAATRSLPLARVDVVDPHCEGAYEFSLEHRTGPNQSAVDYFQRKLAWEAPLRMRIDWSKDGRLAVSVEGVGRVERLLPGNFDQMSFSASAGTLHVSKLEFLNPSAR